MKHTDKPEPAVTAILLAGGQSSRMGCDKALLSHQGRPLWQHMQDLLLRAGCGEVLISGPYEHRDHMPHAVPDPAPGLGPLAGITAVIEARGDALADAWLLIVPVDLPLLNSDVLRLLIQQNKQAAAHFQQHVLPALFHNTKQFRTLLHTTLHTENPRARSVTALHAALGSTPINLPPALSYTLTNTNTPDEWGAAISTLTR